METKPYKVKIYPDAHPIRVAQIYAGLCELDSKRKIQLSWLNHCPHEIRKAPQLSPHTLWMEAENPDCQTSFKLCYDMRDQKEITALTRLNKCDVYIKRSYEPAYIDSLENSLKKKIQ